MLPSARALWDTFLVQAHRLLAKQLATEYKEWKYWQYAEWIEQ